LSTWAAQIPVGSDPVCLYIVRFFDTPFACSLLLGTEGFDFWWAGNGFLVFLWDLQGVGIGVGGGGGVT